FGRPFVGFSLPDSDLGQELAGHLFRLQNDAVDEGVNAGAKSLEKRLDFLGESADAEQVGQKADDDRQDFGQSVFDQLGSAANIAFHNFGDAVDDSLDQLQNLFGLLDEEGHDIVDGDGGLDEGGNGIEKTEDPLDTRLDHLDNQHLLDFFDQHRLKVGELLF